MVRTPAAIRCPPAQFHASVPAFLRSLLPAESYGHVGFHTLAICPPAFPPSPFKSLHLFIFPLKHSIVTHLMGFALHDNASLRCFKIEKWCFFFVLLPQGLSYVRASLMLVDVPLEQCGDAPY